MSLLSTAKTMQGMLLQASPYRGKPPWLFSALFFCEQASQLACVGADAELSSNWHSYTLDVFARAHACRKDSGKQWQPWPEGSTKHSQLATLRINLCRLQRCSPPAPQWKRSSLKKKLEQRKKKIKKGIRNFSPSGNSWFLLPPKKKS